jgi:hypothetical protein
MFRMLNKDLLGFRELDRKRHGCEHMFSLLNNGTRVGNYSSRVCNFLSFSTSAGSQGLRDSLDALYVIDRRAVTKPVKINIGL